MRFAPRSAPRSNVSVRSRQPRLPGPIIFLAVCAIAFFVLPLAGLAWRAPWSKALDVLTQPSIRQALWLSIRTSLLAAIFAFVLGVPLAWLIARVDFPGRKLVRALATISMVLPPVVSGVALFFSFGRRGLFGQYLNDWFGITLPFTTSAVVLAQCFVAMPFLVLTVESAIRQSDPRFEDAARTLGASQWYVFRRVTLPNIKPALIAGLVLAWARALGEFGATITFAGNLPGATRTMSLATYLALETDPESALILSLAMIAISFVVIVALRDRWLDHSPSRIMP